MRSTQNGFSLATSIIAVTVIAVIAVVSWTEISLWQKRNADTHDKASLNSLYAYLEKVHYTQNKSYPSAITPAILEQLTQEQRVDSKGILIASQASNVRYEPSNCLNNVCAAYELKALLENEPIFNRQNISN